MGGAPAIASYNGAYIAGTAVKSIGSAPDGVKGGNPHPPSIESAWRLEPEFNGNYASPRSPLASPTVTMPVSNPLVPPVPVATESEPTSEGDTSKVVDGQPKVDESKQKLEDEISLGYSPGSPRPASTTSHAPSSSTSKYDKIYHKSLGSSSYQWYL